MELKNLKTIPNKASSESDSEDIAAYIDRHGGFVKCFQCSHLPDDDDHIQDLLQACYRLKSSDVPEGINCFLEKAFSLTDREIFDVGCEIEFAFTIIGMMGNEVNLEILEKFANRIIEWDDLFNFNKNAIIALAGIGTERSKKILEALSMSGEKVIFEYALRFK